MKRKIIQVAESTQLVSLPRKWCIEHKLKRGDEVEVVEAQDRVTIFAKESASEPEEVVLKAGGLGRAIYVLVAALYKGGFDEFKIFFDTAEELTLIQRIIKDSCLGFEIVEQAKDFVVARKVSEPIAEEFDLVLRRTLVFVQNMAQDALIAVRDQDKNALNTVIAMDASINKFTYFCRRVLNKQGRGPYRITSPLYYIVEEIEEIADRYKYVCRDRLESKKKLSKPLLQLFEQVNKMTLLFTTLFYKFDILKLNELYKLNVAVQAGMPKYLKGMNKSDFEVLFNLLMIADKIHNLDGPLVLSRYDLKGASAAAK